MIRRFIVGVPCTANNNATRDAWKQTVCEQTADLSAVDGPCKMTVAFHLAAEAYVTAGRFGPDLDNLLKPFMDALGNTVLEPLGDECVVELQVSKRPAVTTDDTGVLLEIQPIPSGSETT